MDKMRALEYFVKVADTGSFSQAAKVFAVPPSSISRRIQDLEIDLGATLFHRTTRVVKLTELGAVYLNQVRPAIAALANADETIREQPDAPSGKLTISAPPGYGDTRVVPALGKLRQLYPDLVLDIELSDQVANIAGNDVDLAIRSTGNPPERAVARKLSNNRFVLVASPGYLDRFKKPEVIDDVVDHKAIHYRGPNGVLSWHAKRGESWEDLRTKPVFISNVGSMLLKEVLSGEGLALIPEWAVADYIRTNELVEIVLADGTISVSRSPQLGIYLLYSRPKYRLKKIQVAVDFLVAELTEANVS